MMKYFYSFLDSFVKGEYWRLLTSKLAFLDTKDAILGLILLYQFRWVKMCKLYYKIFGTFEDLFVSIFFVKSLWLLYFRIFERRYGSRKFASYLVGTSILTSVFEFLISGAMLFWYQNNYIIDGDILNVKGRLLGVGP